MTLATCVQRGIQTLMAAGFTQEDSRRDAGVIGRALLGWDAARWISEQHLAVPPEFEPAFAAAVARRAMHEPVAYITGEREFYGRRFSVTRDVLIPRPETELLVERALSFISPDASGVTVADVGTGSGCVAITLACERPGIEVISTDTSAGALRIAGSNGAIHGVNTRIQWRYGSLLHGLARAVDLVVSNPPYVAERDRLSLAKDVRDWEPEDALFGGPDGFTIIRQLIPASAAALRPGGVLLLEIGAGQAAPVQSLFSQAGFKDIEVHLDLAGIARVITGCIGGLL
jgi:release factor glutamine methyltransferase